MRFGHKNGFVKALSVVSVWLCMMLSASGVSGQTNTATVGEGFAITFTHDGQNTAGYRVYLDNVQIQDLPLSALAAGTARTQPITVTTRGAHTVEVSAYNADRESARAALAFTASLPTPTSPGNLQIVITMALNPDGSISVRWAQQ